MFLSRSCQRWTMFAAFLFLSLVSLEHVWSQPSSKLSSEERMKRDITYLASDECEGRGPGTKGIDKAADYIVDQFKEAGLKPAGVKGSWFQPFTIGGTAKLDGKSTLTLKGPGGKTIELKLGEDFQILGNSGSGNVSAPLVFAGYGATAKGVYDDYKDLDVAGKIVVLIRRVPRWNDKDRPFDGKNKDSHASLENKFSLAEKHKAVAILLINDASEKNDKLVAFNLFTSATPSKIPAANVRREAIDLVLRSGLGKPLAQIEKAIDADLKPQSGPLTGWSGTISCTISRVASQVKNVVGVLDGAGPLADETVVVGAHYDHLGYGGFGSRDRKSEAIHHGADDNASGTTSVMELARRFAAMPKRQGRRIVFMCFSAEERGLLGSRHYCNKEPLFPLDKTVAMVNLDMVGRLSGDTDNKGGKLTIEGVGTAKEFDKLIDKLNDKSGFKITKKQSGTGPSDHDSFYRQKIPVIFFFSGFHDQYHKPTDTSDRINVPGMKRIADMAEQAILHLASDPKRPEYVAQTGGGGTGVMKGPRLGIAPDYDEDKKGVKVAGVTADGVAASAGIKTGDLIVEIAGQPVTTLESYMKIMGTQKIGQTIDIAVMRESKKVVLKATLK